jgi:hypothetical protein
MSDPAKQIPGLEVYPKMVYPGWDGEGMAPSNGVTVKNEDEEKWVADGNNIEDFGKPVKEKKKAEEKPANPNSPNPANPANPNPEGWKAP